MTGFSFFVRYETKLILYNILLYAFRFAGVSAMACVLFLIWCCEKSNLAIKS